MNIDGAWRSSVTKVKFNNRCLARVQDWRLENLSLQFDYENDLNIY